MDGPRNSHPMSDTSHARQFRPVLSQNYIARLFVEANNEFWKPQDQPPRFWAYDAANKCWHKYENSGGHIGRDYGGWRCDQNLTPYCDFRPAIFFDLMRILNLLLETASAAEQRRCGSYAFLNGTIKYLEHHPDIVIEARDLCHPPRPILDEELEERGSVHG